MILVTGGAYQGKTEIAKQVCEKEAGLRVADCGQGDEAALQQADVILHVEQYIKRLLEEGKDQEEIREKLDHLIKENPDAVITVTELGCGVVPMEAFDRRWRETSGRLCCGLAGEAKEVYRVFCGIAERIK